MIAGRELDALVAEKVMGLEVKSITCIDHRGANPDIGTVSAPYKMSDGRMGRQATRIPDYSTDIAAAWQVVEAVQRKNPGWRFGLLGGDVSYGYINGRARDGIDRSQTLLFGWRAEFFGHIDPSQNYGDRHGEARAETAPLAICFAALQAMGVKV